jgi:hypothetical protein
MEERGLRIFEGHLNRGMSNSTRIEKNVQGKLHNLYFSPELIRICGDIWHMWKR